MPLNSQSSLDDIANELSGLNEEALRSRRSGDYMKAASLQAQADKIRAMAPQAAKQIDNLSRNRVLQSRGLADDYIAATPSYYQDAVARGIADKSIKEVGPTFSEFVDATPQKITESLKVLGEMDVRSIMTQALTHRAVAATEQRQLYGDGDITDIQTAIGHADAYSELGKTGKKLFQSYPEGQGTMTLNEEAVRRRAFDLRLTQEIPLSKPANGIKYLKDGREYVPDIGTVRENIRAGDPETMRQLADMYNALPTESEKRKFRAGPLYTQYLSQWNPEQSPVKSDEYGPFGLIKKNVFSDVNMRKFLDEELSPKSVGGVIRIMASAYPALNLAEASKEVWDRLVTNKTQIEEANYWYKVAAFRGAELEQLSEGGKRQLDKKSVDAYTAALDQFKTLTSKASGLKEREQLLDKITKPWILKGGKPPAASASPSAAPVVPAVNNGLGLQGTVQK